MKNKLIALGMVAVMVVGGSVMVFASSSNTTTAAIQFVGGTPSGLPPLIEAPKPSPGLDLPNVTPGDTRPPGTNGPSDPGGPGYQPPDGVWPEGPDPKPEGSWNHPGLASMDLDFGTRDISEINTLVVAGKSIVFNTLNNAEGGFGDALVAEKAPAIPLRVMGVAFQNNNDFQIQVSRGNFSNGFGGADFDLVEYEAPKTIFGDDKTKAVVRSNVTRVGAAANTIVSANGNGRYVASFSGRLSNVNPAQVPQGKSQAQITWTMIPARFS
jgi:hypothetical protein